MNEVCSCQCDSCKQNLQVIAAQETIEKTLHIKQQQHITICPQCHLPQVINSKIWGNGYCVNCMRVTIKNK
jgi:hypothetical protein